MLDLVLHAAYDETVRGPSGPEVFLFQVIQNVAAYTKTGMRQLRASAKCIIICAGRRFGGRSKTAKSNATDG